MESRKKTTNGRSWFGWFNSGAKWRLGVGLLFALSLLIWSVRFADGVSIFDAVDQGDMQQARVLLERHTGVESSKNDHGDTPLHEAARNGDGEIVRLLLSNGADVNAKDKEGATPLQLAVENYHTSVADLLRRQAAHG